METGKLTTRAADIGFETKETQKLIVRVWEELGEGENKKRQMRTFILSLGVTADQITRLAMRKLNSEHVQLVEVYGGNEDEKDKEKDKENASGQTWRALDGNEIPRELINDGVQLAFLKGEDMQLLPFDISRTLKTKAEDVLGLEIYRDPVTGKRGYRWRHKKYEDVSAIDCPSHPSYGVFLSY